jgi:3'-5' exonuclease
MHKLFLDIETIPADESKFAILKEIHARKLEKHKSTGVGKVPESFAEYIHSTGMDGAFGRICCLCYAVDFAPVVPLYLNEPEILTKFWDVAKTVDLFVGFNLMDFDLRFIYQRSVILGVKPTRILNFARYRNDPIYDLMWEWSKWSNTRVSLDTLAKALGIPSSKGGEIEGRNVAQAFKDGRLKEICDYCVRDVEVTRDIYRRMVFEN